MRWKEFPPGKGKDRIVLYLTSSSGVGRTYEDYYVVRMIFMRFRVWMNERDISMDVEYKKELQSVMGERIMRQIEDSRSMFAGGVDVMKHVFEVGELAKILEGFSKRKPEVHGMQLVEALEMVLPPCTLGIVTGEQVLNEFING
ncbi:hypothetical protein L6164_007825 [Bauhinia variegata]|uniref:Uncharacterized protein n=1 Tax=Bauhinia variegata TaxID=167791 RepID=A0ACB9PFZ2_BAUVA|nr:hypothetical protein L6164_007825 [Bauhinia variegata]